MKHIDITTLKLIDLQPSQFYVSKEKIDGILTWFKAEDLSNFNPIPIKLLNDKFVMSDGHTRAVVAIMHNIKQVPLIFEEEDLSWDMYEECVEECINRNIHSPYDLIDKILNKEDYHEKWDLWCDEMQDRVLKKRSEK